MYIYGALKIYMFSRIWCDFEGPYTCFLTFCGILRGPSKNYMFSHIWCDFEGPYKCTFMGTLKIYMFSHVWCDSGGSLLMYIYGDPQSIHVFLHFVGF